MHCNTERTGYHENVIFIFLICYNFYYLYILGPHFSHITFSPINDSTKEQNTNTASPYVIETERARGRGRPNSGFGFGFGADCGQMGTFGGHSVSKAVVPHLVHFRFRRAVVGKFGGCRK